MAAALGALGNDGVDAQRLQMLCQNGRCHHRDHFDAGGFPHGNILAGVARAGGDHLHAFFHHDLGKLVGLRVHQHDVHAERVFGLFFTGADLVTQIVDGCTAACDQTDCAGVGDSRCQCAFCDPCHTALDHGVFAPQQFCDSGFHSYFPS